MRDASENNLSKTRFNDAEINYLIYRTSQLPLEEFFSHLKRGDYKKAFKNIDLSYHPENFEDEALAELIEAGFVPVYVKVENQGSSAIEIDEKSFSLNYREGSVKAFYSSELPNEFRHFSPKAVAANTYNTAVVVVGFAAILAVFVVLAPYGNPDLSGMGVPSNSSRSLYNSVHKKVKVDYKTYLIKKIRLEPGQVTKGLLFFKLDNQPLPSDAHLVGL